MNTHRYTPQLIVENKDYCASTFHYTNVSLRGESLKYMAFYAI